MPVLLFFLLFSCKFSGIDIAAPRCWRIVDEHMIKTSGSDITLQKSKELLHWRQRDENWLYFFCSDGLKLRNFLGNRFDVLRWPETVEWLSVSELTNWWKHYVEIMLEWFSKVTLTLLLVTTSDLFVCLVIMRIHISVYCVPCPWYLQMVQPMFPGAKLSVMNWKPQLCHRFLIYFQEMSVALCWKNDIVDTQFFWDEKVHLLLAFTSTTTVWCPKIQWMYCII